MLFSVTARDQSYNEDCRKTMRRMPSGFVDLIVTSPPYNMNLRIRNGKYCSRQIVPEFSTKYSDFSDNLPLDEFYALHSSALSEMLRVSKMIFYNIQIVTGSKRAFFRMVGEFGDYLKDMIILRKHGQLAMLPGTLNRSSELLLVFSHDAISRQFSKCGFLRGTMDDVWDVSRGTSVGNFHGAVFSEEVVERILLNFSFAGDLIYDPFCGSGTVPAVACMLERHWMGGEIITEYCKFSEERILAAKGARKCQNR